MDDASFRRVVDGEVRAVGRRSPAARHNGHRDEPDPPPAVAQFSAAVDRARPPRPMMTSDVSYRCTRRRRYALGVSPAHLVKARVKELRLSKPTAVAMSSTVVPGAARRLMDRRSRLWSR